jgi:transcriptional regulatory protein LEU3
MNLECRILPTSTRNLRQTKAEMRRELEELRWNLRHGNPNDPTLVLAHGTPASQMSGDHQPFSPQDGTASYMSGPQTDESESMSPPHQSSASGPPTRKPSGGDAATMARSLDGYVVDPTKIAECFTL